MSPTFRRYRLMSFVTGTTLLVLFVTLSLQGIDHSLWVHIKAFRVVVGIGHGVVLYPIYMITCFQMVLKFRLNLLLLVLMFGAGFVPGLAFYLEHRMRRKLYPIGVEAP
jgi:integral membrane protein